ncbi:MAG: hypothetical protein CMD25_02000 [Flavobacteriales bacterium]|jgi:hypothetical protein|nr:hypothetical protein [Flavobacteriales bacterium]
MSISNVKHNKIKNTAILYELLSRQITVDVLNDTKNSPAVKIFKEFFNKNTELGKEYELYRIITEKKYSQESHAVKLLEAVISSRQRLSNRRLNNEKYNLIKTIKENYNVKDFFNTRLPNFKVFASIYKVFGISENPNPIETTDSTITLVEHITSKPKNDKGKSKVMENLSEQDKDLRLLTYQLLVDKFNSKYKSLNESQKDLLKEYINNLSNTNSLNEFVNSEIVKIKSTLKKYVVKVDDDITRIKLEEAINHIDTLVPSKVVKDKNIISLMRYYELIKELKDVTIRKTT